MIDKRPDAFGVFRVRADLGTGRFGPIYLARDRSTKTRVVIRTFVSPDIRRHGVEPADLLESFETLCKSGLEHPNLARPIGCGVEGDIPYIAYAHLPGTAMDVLVREGGKRPVSEVLRRVTQLAEAIDLAAATGLHHGGMSPSDIIVNGDATGVAGFGLVQALLRAGISVDAQPPYASPQRLAGAVPSVADDIYSLGAVTLEMVIGAPTESEHDTNGAARQTLSLSERTRVSRPAPHETRLFTTIPGVDAGLLRASFAAAFSEDPSARPSTASEFVSSFQYALVNERKEVERVEVEDKPAEPDQADENALSAFSEDAPVRPSTPAAHTSEAAVAEPTARLPFRLEMAPLSPEEQSTPKAESHPEPPPLHDHEPLSSAELRPSPVERRPSPAELRWSQAEWRPAAASMSYASPVVPEPREGRFVRAAAIVFGLAAAFAGGVFVGQRYWSGSTMSLTAPQTQTALLESQPSGSPPPISGSDAPVPAPEARVPSPGSPAPAPEVRVPSPGSRVPAPEARVPRPGSRVPARPDPGSSPARPPAAPANSRTGGILVRSTPAGAEVMLDGQSRGVTPLALRELALGDYVIDVVYGPDRRQQRVTLTAARPARSIDFELRRTDTARFEVGRSAAGGLQIASRPAGARVFVDDSLIGTTPMLVSGVTAGSHRVRLELPGYQPWSTSVQIEPNERFRVSASLNVDATP